MKLNHNQAINWLRREGFGVDDNPDLMDVLCTTSPLTCGRSAKLQVRYWDLRLGRNFQILSGI